jgi:AraC family transcriptional activator of pobA
MRIADTPQIPRFFLYGEPPREVGERFLHLENLDDRSRPSEWNIRPHAHADLHHVFHILNGAGEMRTEHGIFRLAAPTLVLVPAGVIHGFIFQPESAGCVLTSSRAYTEEIFVRAPALRELFDVPGEYAVAPDGEEGRTLRESLARLGQELNWAAPGHEAAVEAQLITFLVETLRIMLRHRHAAISPPGRQAELVARFRELIESEFRAALPVEAYARRLGVSVPRLRTACQQAARRPPGRLIEDRIILEAKRLLLYSNLSVATIGYALGFEDAAYFSRFFKKVTLRSPRGFRAPECDPPTLIVPPLV